MNIALPALITFVVLLPGFIARSRIKRVERSTLDFSPFGRVVSEAVVWSAGLHLVWIALTPYISARAFNAHVFLSLFSVDSPTQAKALEDVARDTSSIAMYFGSMLVVTYIMPAMFRSFVTRNRWDRLNSRLSPVLRFSGAPWYYLLSGADFESDSVPDMIAVSAVVDVAGEAILYKGILEDYFVDGDGQLDRLVLAQVVRRPFANDKPDDATDRALERFYPIDGDYFVLRYSEAITLNIEYIKLAEAPVEGIATQGA